MTVVAVMAPSVLVIVLLLVGSVLALVCYAFTWAMTYKPSRKDLGRPEDFGVTAEDVYFYAEDGVKLHGWWIACPDAETTLLYCHGNAGNISDRSQIAADLSRLGYHVFLFDYRGYGKSEGWASEKGLYRDARAACEYVRGRLGHPEEARILLYGRSLGGAVASRVARDIPVVGLWIESSFSSSLDVGRTWFPYLPVGLFTGRRFRSVDHVAHIDAPKLFLHSRRDETVPFHTGEMLYEAASEPKTFAEIDVAHGDIAWRMDNTYRENLDAWLSLHSLKAEKGDLLPEPGSQK